MRPFAKLLVPTDFSASAEAATARAVDLAQRYGAELILLHVYEPPAAYEGFVFDRELMGSLEAIARERLERARAQVVRTAVESGKPITVDAQLAKGSPADVILTAAHASGCDLVVLGTHGRSGLSHLLLGSVAERVVRHARCAVLTTR